MINKTKYVILLTIFIIAFICSGILTFVSVEEDCGGVQTTCYAVQTSQYETTFGIKNAHMGLVAFSIMAILIFLHLKQPTKNKKQIIKIGIILGSIFALYFLYIQFFVIDALCKYCMIIDMGMLINLGIIAFWKEK